MWISEPLISQTAEALRGAGSLLIASHIRPDGDAIGSLLGFGLALEEAGKPVQMVLSDELPLHFRHLPGVERILRTMQGQSDFAIVVDCSDLQRTGEALAGRTPDLNIDHHITNTNFGRINVIDTQSAATAEMLARLLPRLGLKISPSVAANLLTGLIADTLGFRTSSVTPSALRIAADLMEAGGDLPRLYRQALLQRTFEAGRYWGAGLSRLEHENGLVWATLTLADRQGSEYPGRDDADLINVVSSIEGADVALIFVEQPEKRVKISWRSQPGIDVSIIAAQFGGGGHRAAAGAEVDGALEPVKRQVLDATLQAVTGQKLLLAAPAG